MPEFSEIVESQHAGWKAEAFKIDLDRVRAIVNRQMSCASAERACSNELRIFLPVAVYLVQRAVDAGVLELLPGEVRPAKWNNWPHGRLTRMNAPMTDTLHVFQIGDGDTVVARSARDAWDILTETSGTTPEDMPGEEWAQLDDSAPLRIGCEDPPVEHGFPSDDGWAKPEGRSIWVSERTCAEWVALCGRGVLGGPD